MDDALLIEGEDNYNKILRKVREQARRQSVTKLKAEISKLDAKIIGYEETLNRPEQMEIIGYEETVNRTEQMERELQDLLNRRKVYNKVLDKKEKKRLAEPKRLSIDRLEAEISILNERIASYEGIKNLSNRKKNELQEMRDRLQECFPAGKGQGDKAGKSPKSAGKERPERAPAEDAEAVADP